ncbi:HutD/Ves family protein [Dongia deserti]|uniref:HutD/Ves family protein n=1 Tax=Dongia deserti TaxID=2268030 RepID=UPI000E6562DA|nr:HutD family protein [Dongia deserti]
MTGRVLHPDNYQRMPWKNGGGTTTEIWKAASPDGEMLWRLSIADVASDGPFSVFPGIDRWIMVIEGKGMELTIDGQVRQIDDPFKPLAFSGDAKADCRLVEGPIRDFNLMVARSYGSGALRVSHLAPGASQPFAENVAALHVLRGRIELESGTIHALSASDSWIAGTYGGVTARAFAPTILAVVVIEPHQQAAL